MNPNSSFFSAGVPGHSSASLSRKTLAATSAAGTPRTAVCQSMIAYPSGTVKTFSGWKSRCSSRSPSGSASTSRRARARGRRRRGTPSAAGRGCRAPPLARRAASVQRPRAWYLQVGQGTGGLPDLERIALAHLGERDAVDPVELEAGSVVDHLDVRQRTGVSPASAATPVRTASASASSRGTPDRNSLSTRSSRPGTAKISEVRPVATGAPRSATRHSLMTAAPRCDGSCRSRCGSPPRSRPAGRPR